MELSFREHAAISLACRSSEENESPFGDAAVDAQKLANQCCEKWGHVLYQGDCDRCGEKDVKKISALVVTAVHDRGPRQGVRHVIAEFYRDSWCDPYGGLFSESEKEILTRFMNGDVSSAEMPWKNCRLKVVFT